MNAIRAFPGHFAAAFIPRVSADGVVEVLVIGALPIEFEGASQELQVKKLQIKMPGGCAVNEQENANLPSVVIREVVGEIGKNSDFRVEVRERVFERKKSAYNPGDPDHVQAFYHVQVRGELRTENMVEDEGDEILFPPFWLEVQELWKILFRSHKEPLVAGLELLARESSDIAFEYADILGTYRAGQV